MLQYLTSMYYPMFINKNQPVQEAYTLNDSLKNTIKRTVTLGCAVKIFFESVQNVQSSPFLSLSGFGLTFLVLLLSKGVMKEVKEDFNKISTANKVATVGITLFYSIVLPMSINSLCPLLTPAQHLYLPVISLFSGAFLLPFSRLYNREITAIFTSQDKDLKMHCLEIELMVWKEMAFKSFIFNIRLAVELDRVRRTQPRPSNVTIEEIID